MSKGKRRLLVLLTVLLCVGCDQMTKELARSHLPRSQVLSFAGDLVRFDYTENRGAVLSFEYCLPQTWRGPAVTLAVTTSLILLLGHMLFVSALQPFPIIALSLICGGALSNLLDRIAFGGLVVDFLSLGRGAFRTAIFNVADIAIVTGAVLLGLSILRKLRPS